MALIAIATRSDKLQKQVLAVAKRIGKVEVDHGDTSCKTPDAAGYILKVTEYKKRVRQRFKGLLTSRLIGEGEIWIALQASNLNGL